jgi:hypothetical protein
MYSAGPKVNVDWNYWITDGSGHGFSAIRYWKEHWTPVDNRIRPYRHLHWL